MENREHLNKLFDIYQKLLTSIEQDTFINYYQEDLSLNEIAENRHITKSAVAKTLKQVSSKLNHYETILKLLETKTILTNLLKEQNLKTIKQKIEEII